MSVEKQLSIDSDVLVVGEASTDQGISRLTQVVESSKRKFVNLNTGSAYRKLQLLKIKKTNPALYEVCESLISHDCRSVLPRGVEKLLSKSKTLRSPIEGSLEVNVNIERHRKVMTEEEKQAIYEEGYAAYGSGEEESNCPHPTGFVDAPGEHWCDGWADAAEDDKYRGVDRNGRSKKS